MLAFQSCVLGRRTSIFQGMYILRLLCGYLEHQSRVQFEGYVAEPLQTIMAILLHCASRCTERSDEGGSAFATEGLRGRSHSPHVTASQGVARYCGECAAVSFSEGGKEEKKVIASCSFVEEKFQDCSQTEGVGLATSVET